MIYILLAFTISLCFCIFAKGLGITHDLTVAQKKRRIVKYLKRHESASLSEISKALHKRNMDILPLLIGLQRDELVTAEKVSIDEGCSIKVYRVI